MPMLFFLGQHALRAVQARLEEGELIFACVDVCTSSVLQPSCRKSCGDTPGFTFIMGRRKFGTGLETARLVATFWTAVRALDQEFTTVWRGGGDLAHQGIVILGMGTAHLNTSHFLVFHSTHVMSH